MATGCEIPDSECDTILAALFFERKSAEKDLESLKEDMGNKLKMSIAGELIKSSVSIANGRIARIDKSLK